MWQGNEGGTLQTVEKKIEDAYSDNVRLVELAKDGNEEALAVLVETNKGLVKSIAIRFLDRGVDLDDLMQIGTIGVIKAARNFDLSRDLRFSTYAVPLIFGEIRRHMRDEGPIKIGRYYKRLGSQLLSERTRILAEEGREPRIAELAEICGVSSEDAAVALDAVSPIVSLSDSAYNDEEGAEIGDIIADEESLSETERLFDRLALREAISKMPDMWREIVALRFYRDMTQQQTADVLGVTQVKISREEKKLIEFLRSKML